MTSQYTSEINPVLLFSLHSFNDDTPCSVASAITRINTAVPSWRGGTGQLHDTGAHWPGINGADREVAHIKSDVLLSKNELVYLLALVGYHDCTRLLPVVRMNPVGT